MTLPQLFKITPKIKTKTKNNNNMKTLFAFLGLFMFASVTSTDITNQNIANDEPQLMETGEYSTSPAKKRDILAATNETGEYSTSPAKKRDILA